MSALRKTPNFSKGRVSKIRISGINADALNEDVHIKVLSMFRFSKTRIFRLKSAALIEIIRIRPIHPGF